MVLHGIVGFNVPLAKLCLVLGTILQVTALEDNVNQVMGQSHRPHLTIS